MNVLPLFRSLPKERTFLETLSLESRTCVLGAFAHENSVRPELTSLLLRFPSVLADYLVLGEKNKSALQDFSQHSRGYLLGEGDGYPIRFLDFTSVNGFGFVWTSDYPGAARVARQSRWSHQLLRLFDAYLVEKDTCAFTNAYIARSPIGYNLLHNLSHRNYSVTDIVSLVVSVRPEIRKQYVPPHISCRRKAKVIPLRS